mgnify:CR=1 FL=1
MREVRPNDPLGFLGASLTPLKAELTAITRLESCPISPEAFQPLFLSPLDKYGKRVGNLGRRPLSEGMNSFSGTGLQCIRSARMVFDGLSFSARAGDVLYLKGPNGSGKSSLLRVMAGLLRPAAGEMLWNGTNTRADLEEFRASLNYVGHRDAVKGAFTVRENLSFWAAMADGDLDEGMLSTALEAFDLSRLADLPARFLSTGQTRRLNLARLLTSSAPLWILDEPATSLDAANAAALRNAVESHVETGGIVVMATHEEVSAGGQILELSEYGVKGGSA